MHAQASSAYHPPHTHRNALAEAVKRRTDEVYTRAQACRWRCRQWVRWGRGGGGGPPPAGGGGGGIFRVMSSMVLPGVRRSMSDLSPRQIGTHIPSGEHTGSQFDNGHVVSEPSLVT